MTHAQTSTAVERELAIEQAHVDLVYTRLAEATRSAEQVARAGRALYQADRGTYLREEDGTGLYERDVFAFQTARRLAVLDAEHEGLVFGRLDRTDGEIRYVGRIGVRDVDYEPLVVDWRAPAAEPFYRATPTHPMEVIRRRVLRCQGETVVGISDDLLDSSHANGDLVVLGEGALMAALTRARGHTMRDIVATIQAEQDEAIRAPYQGFTMITGGPGTGKTVVALHRAAYLLYSNRRRFESGGVLVVGPSRVFMSYIEQVLPSLGEESVTLKSIGAVAADVVAITGDRVDPPSTAAVKGSLRMTRVLRAAGPRATAVRAAGAPGQRQGSRPGAAGLGAGPDPRRGAGPPQAQPRPRGGREGGAGRAVASPPVGAGSWTGTTSTPRSPMRPSWRRSGPPGGRPSAHRQH